MNIIIPITPITKKTHQQIIRVNGRPMVIPSKQYKQFEKACEEWLRPYSHLNIDYPVNLSCRYYMPTRRRVDLVNLAEATCDILVKYGVLKDDNSNIVASMDGSRVFYDKENPRTCIDITPLG